ncbi:Uma2 family endonuclease [Myxosarcina sp. GI1]|uniref:Uma2 family endonuclease n=1 Tax=Myxosarcina sp. GI1 TaxID=1541065 RepID=UPI000566EB31|nr:Uma2 family endonuclease [Myxosarcina sp. GI1]
MIATSPTKLITDTWVTATWDEYLQNIEHPDCKKTKGYYYDGKYRIEMTPIGNDHSKDHCSIQTATSLFAISKQIAIDIRDNCSYRKTGFKEFQPDLSCYVGDNADAIPWGTGVINLDEYPTPDLVIEIANTSLSDDLGAKRLLYEELEIAEYWIVDVHNALVMAFKIENRGSRRVTESTILPGLEINVLTEALVRSRQSNHTQVGTWLLQQFQQ